MDYSKESVDSYITEMIKNSLATEIAIEYNQFKIDKINKDLPKAEEKLIKAGDSLRELDQAKKTGTKDREVREARKELRDITQEKFDKLTMEIMDMKGTKERCEKNIALYKEFLETAEYSIERAKVRLGSKV